MPWVNEEECYVCETCNTLFYVEIIEPEVDMGFREVTYCPLCSDDTLIKKEGSL